MKHYCNWCAENSRDSLVQTKKVVPDLYICMFVRCSNWNSNVIFTLCFPFLSSWRLNSDGVIESRNIVQQMIAFCSFIYITRYNKPSLEFKGRYTRNSLTLEITQKGNPITLDCKVALFLFQLISFSLSKICSPWSVLKVYRHSWAFRVNPVACHSIRKLSEHRYVAATEWSPINGEDDRAEGICCLL
jgi:hypothetical protein